MRSSIHFLIILFIFETTMYNALVPLGEGPDEPGHMRYVLFLAREHRLPVQHTDDTYGDSDVAGEGHQPPLAYLLMLPAVLWLPADDIHFDQRANPAFVWNGGNEPAAFIRTSREYWPWQGVILAWHMARGISSLFGVITLLLIWKAAQALINQSTIPLRQRTHVALLATMLVVFNPQFVFTSALVTNDTLLAALSAAIFLVCITQYSGKHRDRKERKGSEHVFRHAVLLGLLFGLALLAKQSAMLLVPLMLWSLWRTAGAMWQHFTRLIFAWAGTALLIAGWWYARNWYLYGDPLGLQAFQATFATQPFAWHDPLAWGTALLQLHASFWATFGWLSVYPPGWVIGVYTVLELVALAGLVKLFAASYHHNHATLTTRLVRYVHVALLLCMAVAWTMSFAYTAGLVAWQGRMLFPALVSIAFLLARGLVAWTPAQPCPPTDIRCFPEFVTPLLLLLLALYLPGTLTRAYPTHTLPPATARDRIDISVYARYAKEWEQGAELRGVQIYNTQGTARHAAGVQAGQTITTTLTWHALEPVPFNWTVFVHLVNEQGDIVAEHNSQPQAGLFPMSLWSTGDWVEDPHPLVLPHTLQPGRYALRVGWYKPWQRDPQKGSRQQVWDREGQHTGDYAEVGTINVAGEF